MVIFIVTKSVLVSNGLSLYLLYNCSHTLISGSNVGNNNGQQKDIFRGCKRIQLQLYNYVECNRFEWNINETPSFN